MIKKPLKQLREEFTNFIKQTKGYAETIRPSGQMIMITEVEMKILNMIHDMHQLMGEMIFLSDLSLNTKSKLMGTDEQTDEKKDAEATAHKSDS